MNTFPDIPIHEELSPTPTFQELVCILIDKSGSMNDPMPDGQRTKAEEVEYFLFRGQDSLLERLKTSLNSDKQNFCAITFDDTVSVMPVQPLGQVTVAVLENQFAQPHGNRTAIEPALDEAFNMVRPWIEQADPYIPRFATILLMSDGCENCGTNPIAAAEGIKKWSAEHSGDLPRPPILIATAPFGSDADRATLTAVACPNPKDGQPMCKFVKTGSELRDFFLASLHASTPARLG